MKAITVNENNVKQVVRCSRCGRRLRSLDGWNVVFHAGVATGFLCPECQTPEEDLEAQVNDAMLDYKPTEDGRMVGFYKASGIIGEGAQQVGGDE